MARKKKTWEIWLENIARGAADGALNNEHAQDGAKNMVAGIIQKYKWPLIAAAGTIILLTLATIAGLFKRTGKR